MNESIQQSQRRAETALHLNFLTCGVHALMASHPNPEALREAWNREMAALWANHSAVMAGADNPLKDLMLRLQERYEAQLPAPPQ